MECLSASGERPALALLQFGEAAREKPLLRTLDHCASVDVSRVSRDRQVNITLLSSILFDLRMNMLSKMEARSLNFQRDTVKRGR